jgi:hypothetical protein
MVEFRPELKWLDDQMMSPLAPTRALSHPTPLNLPVTSRSRVKSAVHIAGIDPYHLVCLDRFALFRRSCALGQGGCVPRRYVPIVLITNDPIIPEKQTIEAAPGPTARLQHHPQHPATAIPADP